MVKPLPSYHHDPSCVVSHDLQLICAATTAAGRKTAALATASAVTVVGSWLHILANTN